MDTNTPMTIDNGGPAEPPDNAVATAPDDWDWDDIATAISQMPDDGLHLLDMTSQLQIYRKDFEDGAADPQFASFLSGAMAQCSDDAKALIGGVAAGNIHTDEAAQLNRMVRAELSKRAGIASPDDVDIQSMDPGSVETLAIIAQAATSPATFAIDDEGNEALASMARRSTNRQRATLRRILDGDGTACRAAMRARQRNRMRGLS